MAPITKTFTVKQSKPRIGIIGGTIWGNRGAESMLTTTIGMLRKDFPDARFIIFSYYPEKDRTLIGDLEIKILSSTPFALITGHFLGAIVLKIARMLGLKQQSGKLFNTAVELSSCDVLLEIGGITFSDGREKYLPFNILTIWPAMILGVPVIKLSQALGPFRNGINRNAAGLFLSKCRHIFARGSESLEHLRSLGLPEEKISLSPDIAFCFDLKFSLSHENEEMRRDLVRTLTAIKESGKKIIAISPSVLVEKQSQNAGIDYLGIFNDFMNDMDSRDHHFVIFPNASRKGIKKTHNNDLVAIEKMKEIAILEGQVKVGVSWVTYDINSAAIREIVRISDLLITSRFHAMIAALCERVPVLVVGWSHKYDEVLKLFGLGEYALDFKDADCTGLKDMAVQMVQDQQAIRNRIASKFESIRVLSADQFKQVAKILE